MLGGGALTAMMVPAITASGILYPILAPLQSLAIHHVRVPAAEEGGTSQTMVLSSMPPVAVVEN